MRIKFVHLLSIVLFLFFFALLSFLPAQEQNKSIKIGVRALSGFEAALDKWSATAEYLSHAIDGYQFEMVPLLGFEEMEEAVKNKSIHFVLTNPTAYTELEYKQGVARIATLINGRGRYASNQFAGVIFARADRSDIGSLSDIKGKSIMGVHPKAFGGWRMALGELKNNGIIPSRDCSEIMFGDPQEKVVFGVQEGIADVGTVRTGILERLAERGKIDFAEFKIIGRKKDNFFLPHSTQLYPEWPFSRTVDTPDDLVHKVLASLMIMPPDSQAAIKGRYTGWTVSMDYSDVYKLMKELRVAPFEGVGQRTFGEFVKDYWQLFFFIAFTLIVSILTVLYIAGLHRKLRRSYDTLERKVQERTLHLQEEVAARGLAEKELRVERNNLRNILDSMDDGVYIVNLQHDIQYVNPVLVREFGACEGLKCYKYFHARDEACPWCKIEDVSRGKTVQWEWSSSLGKTYDLLDTPIMLPDGSTGKLEIFRDITERKQIEEELKKHHEQLKTLVRERTAELETKNADLERMNDLFVGRELRIKELRDRVKELQLKAGC